MIFPFFHYKGTKKQRDKEKPLCSSCLCFFVIRFFTHHFLQGVDPVLRQNLAARRPPRFHGKYILHPFAFCLLPLKSVFTEQADGNAHQGRQDETGSVGKAVGENGRYPSPMV
jgi:hypothetical protein